MKTIEENHIWLGFVRYDIDEMFAAFVFCLSKQDDIEEKEKLVGPAVEKFLHPPIQVEEYDNEWGQYNNDGTFVSLREMCLEQQGCEEDYEEDDEDEGQGEHETDYEYKYRRLLELELKHGMNGLCEGPAYPTELLGKERCTSGEDVKNFMLKWLIEWDWLEEEDYKETPEYSEILKIAKSFPNFGKMEKLVESLNYIHLLTPYKI